MLEVLQTKKSGGPLGETVHNGKCFCGAVEVTVTGAPIAMGYCHCASCRQWSAGPVNAFTLWKPDAVKVTKGQADLSTYHKTEKSHRRWCQKCGGHVLTEHPTWKITDVYAALLPTLNFQPALHVNYGESVLRVKDGLPKFKDFPADFGGSGQTLPE